MACEDSTQVHSFDAVWALQAQLNKKAGFDTAQLGKALNEALDQGKLPKGHPAALCVGKALKNYIDAMASECQELQDCLSWKHWYKEAKEGRQYELQDLQNARVEAIDMLFFWVSICQLLGLSPQDVLRLYGKKLEINHRRQDQDRTQAAHDQHEDENRNVV
jgi:hypothetical protein